MHLALVDLDGLTSRPTSPFAKRAYTSASFSMLRCWTTLAYTGMASAACTESCSPLWARRASVGRRRALKACSHGR